MSPEHAKDFLESPFIKAEELGNSISPASSQHCSFALKPSLSIDSFLSFSLVHISWFSPCLSTQVSHKWDESIVLKRFLWPGCFLIFVLITWIRATVSLPNKIVHLTCQYYVANIRTLKIFQINDLNIYPMKLEKRGQLNQM